MILALYHSAWLFFLRLRQIYLLDKNFDFIGDLECVALLISAIDTHCKNAKVVKNACLALASLVEPDGKDRNLFDAYVHCAVNHKQILVNFLSFCNKNWFVVYMFIGSL